MASAADPTRIGGGANVLVRPSASRIVRFVADLASIVAKSATSDLPIRIDMSVRRDYIL